MSIDSGAIIVTAAGTSINAKAGLKGKTGVDGVAGNVTLHSYSIQQLPTNLDLTSTVANIKTSSCAQVTN